MKSYRCVVSGKVQGVYYRKNINQNAMSKDFVGYVKNLPNGDVEACVSCEEAKLEQFLEILRKGSPKSRVDNIEVSTIEEKFTKFEIRY